MAHVRVFGAAAPAARGIIHWGATSAYVTDNTDLIQMREGLALVERRLVAVLKILRDFALAHRDLPALAYTHFQPAQPTTVGKRATLWASDLLMDLEAARAASQDLRFLGAKGATGTQASFLRLFDGDSAARRGAGPRARRARRLRPAPDGLRPDVLAQAGRPRRPRPLRPRASRRTSSPRTCACSSTRASSRSPSRPRRSAPPRCPTSATPCAPKGSARSRATSSRSRSTRP